MFTFVCFQDKSKPKPNNGTAEAAKITRAEFLKILDRNFKGLARLRNLEWREARKVCYMLHPIES